MDIAPDREDRLILCIDGGGVRGIVPAMILRELEQKLHQRGKTQHLAAYFDLIAGTSTGGIIALGLCAENKDDKTMPACTAEELVDLYENRSRHIFGELGSIVYPFTTIYSGPKYTPTYLEKVLNEMLGDANTEDVLTNFIVSAYEIQQRRPKIFSNTRPDGRKVKYRLRELARATSAAPTFFEPAQVEKLHDRGKFETLIDGGVFAPNPSMLAIMHAQELGWDITKTTILSLGTGTEARAYPYYEVKEWGSVGWIHPGRGTPIISMLMQGQTFIIDHYANLTLNFGKINLTEKRYLRIDAPLSDNKGNDNLDDSSKQNIGRLKTFAENLILDRDNQAVLEHIADLAVARPFKSPTQIA